MATLTTHRALELVELYLEIEPAPNDPDWLVLRGGRCWIELPSVASGPRSSAPRSGWSWLCGPES
jgi:hypothetical protein